MKQTKSSASDHQGTGRGFEFFKSLFDLDLRSLAVFRILFGFLIALDTFQKSLDAQFFFTDVGLLPRSVLLDSFSEPFGISFHLANGRLGFILVCLLVHFAAAIAMMVGWRTTLSTLLTWVFVCSLQARNGLILSGADDLMRLALFWSMFLPTGARFSVDARRSGNPTIQTIRGFASFTFIFQLFLMYFVTASLKSDPEWRRDFTAVFYTMKVGSFTSHFGRWIGQYKAALKISTMVTIALEFLTPLICLFGLRARTLVICLLISMHVGITLTMTVGLFPYLSIAYAIALVPTFIWSWRPLKLAEIWLDRRLGIGESRRPRGGFTKWIWWIQTPVLLLGLIGVICQNARNLDKSYTPSTPVRALIGTLSLYQGWLMFAPRPETIDGWFIADGKFEDGSEFDLLTGAPVTFTEPDLISDTYYNTQWRRLLWRLKSDGAKVQLPFARALCRTNSRNNGRALNLKTLEIYFMQYKIERGVESRSPIEKLHVWSHDCFGK